VAIKDQQYLDKQARYLPLHGLLAWPLFSFRSQLSLGGCLLLFAAGAQSQSLDISSDDCVIKPYQVANLSSPVPGVIKKILVEQDEFVTSGQAVVQMEDRVERVIVELARGRDFELNLAEEQLEQKVIRSTIDGFVISRFKNEGESVDDQPILRVAQLDPLNVEAVMPMKYVGMIQPGMTAEVNPEMSGSKPREARVTFADQVLDETSNTFGVRLEMSNPELEIPPGLQCDVTFFESPEGTTTASSLAQAATLLISDSNVAPLPSPIDARDAATDKPLEQKTATVQRSPLTLGPFLSLAALHEASDSLQELDIEVRTKTVADTASYIVLTIAEGNAALQQLKESGLKDYYYNKKPPYIGHYSLGVFGLRDNAYSLAAEAEQQGVATEVLDRGLEKNLWWIDLLVSPEEIESHADALEQIRLKQEKSH